MKRLSLDELKTQKSKLIVNLDAIKGGNNDGCHITKEEHERMMREIGIK
jgi:hypothetical protein